jgi:L-Ala-D/L-Glu epimerase
MKIIGIKTKVLNLEFIKPIVVTFGTIRSLESLIIEIETDEGLLGYGEASPYSPVTGETIDTVQDTLKLLTSHLIGQNPLKIAKIHRIMDQLTLGQTSAKAAIDIALYDIYAKSLNVPLHVALGGERETFESDKTVSIGTIEEMVRDVKSNMAQGFNMVKLKAGIDIEKDILALKAIRKECGNDLIIRMDANQGWNSSDAVRALNAMEPYKLDCIEQPIPYWDIDGLIKIREKTNIPLMADESLHNEKDAIRLLKSEAVDLFNIKLMKSKGIFGALKINTIAEASGIQCMIGCMVESPIGITAGAHFAAANKNITRVDLDSLFAIKTPSVIEKGVKYTGGMATLPSEAGLGIAVDRELF